MKVSVVSRIWRSTNLIIIIIIIIIIIPLAQSRRHDNIEDTVTFILW